MVVVQNLCTDSCSPLEVFIAALDGAEDVLSLDIHARNWCESRELMESLCLGFCRWRGLERIILPGRLFAIVGAHLPKTTHTVWLLDWHEEIEDIPTQVTHLNLSGCKLDRLPRMRGVTDLTLYSIPKDALETPPVLRHLRIINVAMHQAGSVAALLRSTPLEKLDGDFHSHREIKFLLQIKRLIWPLLGARFSPVSKAYKFVKQDGDSACLFKVMHFLLDA